MASVINRWLTLIARRRAQRSYIKKLGPLLQKRYGRAQYYTIAQVRKTIEISGLDVNYMCYGLAEYCSEEDFNSYHQSVGEACDYSGMRSEMETAWSVGHDANSQESLDSGGHYGGNHGDSGHSGDFGGHGH